MAIEHRMDGALGRDGNSGESAQEALANLAGTPGRVFALHVQDEVFHLEGKLMRIAVGPSAAVRQPLHPHTPGSGRRFCSPSCARSQTPCRDPPFARRLAGEPRTVASHPSPNTPSKASLPPKKQEEVSPMCPVRCVTYVSGRSLPLLSIRLSDTFHTFRTLVGGSLGGCEAPNRTIARNLGTGERKSVRSTVAQGADPSSCR